MRRRLPLGLVCALLAGAAILAPPASAATGGFTVSAATVAAGATVTVTSSTPCGTSATPPAQREVYAALVRWSGEVALEVVPTAAADGSWRADIAVPSSTPTGRYVVEAFCISDPDSEDGYVDYGPKELDVVPAGPGSVRRLAGPDRIATAIAISRDLYPARRLQASAVLSRSDSYADAFAGGQLAAAVGGPLLLTHGDSVDQAVLDELDRVLDPADAYVYVLGGTAAISQHVEEQLKDLGYEVERVAGLNRYATAARVANDFTDVPQMIFLANGNDFHDGLVAAAAARSMALDGVAVSLLLTDGGALPAETQRYLSANPDVHEVAIGGVAGRAAPKAEVVGSFDPVATAVAVAQRFYPTSPVAAVASVDSFADALTGGSHADMVGGPLLYTTRDRLSQPVADLLSGRGSSIALAYVYGGTGAITDGVVAAVTTAISR